jgi:hypothetical protein
MRFFTFFTFHFSGLTGVLGISKLSLEINSDAGATAQEVETAGCIHHREIVLDTEGHF